MSLKVSLLKWIPDAYYENGTEAKCIWYRIFNMFDVDSQSFKEVKVKRNMKNEKKYPPPILHRLDNPKQIYSDKEIRQADFDRQRT